MIPVAALILLLLPTGSSSFEPLSHYMAKFERQGSSVFLSQCGHDPDGRAVLAFGMGEGKGLLLELYGPTVVNLATVSTNGNDVTIDETHGGVYSYSRVHDLAKDLVRSQFSLLAGARLHNLLELKPSRRCRVAAPVP
jgi:hypothetical protein